MNIGIGIGIPIPLGTRSSAANPLTFLLRDDFTSAASAPLTSPRTAEPGPGTLTLVQTDGQFSISSNKLNFSAQATPAWGDQYIVGGVQTRQAGRTFLATFAFSTFNYHVIGFNNDATPADITLGVEGFRPEGVSFRAITNGTPVELGVNLTNTTYTFVVAMRATGSFCIVKGGVFTNWTLGWAGNAGTASGYPAFSNYNSAGTLDNFRVLDLPAPFNTDYGLATQRLSGAVAQGTTFTHEANCVIEWTQTTVPSSSQTQIAIRQQDSSNRWYVAITSTGAISLFEVVAGTPTSRATAAAVVSSGHRIVIVCDGTTIRGYANNVLRWTYSSASNFVTETNGNFLFSGADSAVSDIISWPRVLGSTAAALLDAAVA